MFTTTILVRFGDLDAAGIAYYPNLVNYLHESFEDFFAGHVGRPYPEVYREGLAFPHGQGRDGVPGPVHYGDHVDVDVIVERVGRSSVQIRYEGAVGGRPVFRARNVAVVVEMKSFRPIQIPPWLRERFEAAKGSPATVADTARSRGET
jgi:acyl-CoA thioesterase FadM